MSARRLRSFASLFVSLACVSSCGDSESSGGAGGSSSGSGGVSGSGGSPGNGGGTQGGTAGQTGNVGGGSGTGGSSGGGQIVPDPLKDCGQAASPSASGLTLTEVADGLAGPVYVTQPRGDNERLFIVEKPGTVRILRGGMVEEPPFLDIEARVDEDQNDVGEMGLLGFAFHPDYLSNGRFYVNYTTDIDGADFSRVSEFTVSADPDDADEASEQVLLEVQQPETNHNGGDLEFGLDGFLYIGFGDGGGGGDGHGPIGNGQNLQTLLGKILRIDVDGTGAGPNAAYAVPSGNIPNDTALDEIWSYGLRNPWRFSFDACTGDMYIADVGQDFLEEIDFEPALTPGRNYGWRLMEGDACYEPESGCNASTQTLALPIASHGRDAARSITGGYVYRGSAIPNLRGTYLYADYATNRFFALRMNGGQLAGPPQDITADLDPPVDPISVSSFGQDNAGELYVVSLGGSVYKIEAE
jgi:glucose/arabinose dehydrogenase